MKPPSARAGCGAHTEAIAVTTTTAFRMPRIESAPWLNPPDRASVMLAAPENSARTSALVQAVREATRRFQDPAVALAENYVPTFGCVSGSSEGQMGVHFVNFGLVFDNVIDVAHPDVLLYEPLPNNR